MGRKKCSQTFGGGLYIGRHFQRCAKIIRILVIILAQLVEFRGNRVILRLSQLITLQSFNW